MAKSKILVVEDENIVALGIERLLKRNGYEVIGLSASAESAFALAAKTWPDVVLMDIVLEGSIDGIEMAKIFRNHWRVPIIYITAYADDRILARAKATQPEGFIVKPFDDREIHAAIQMALYKRKEENRDLVPVKETERGPAVVSSFDPDLFHEVLRMASDAVIALDEKQNVVLFNQQAEAFFGYTRQEVIGKPLLFLIPERFRKNHPNNIKRFEEEAISRIYMEQRKELWGLRKNGEEFPIEVTISKLVIDGKKYFIAMVRDITGKKEAEEKILHQAYYDSLTGFPNRNLLHKRLKEAIWVGKERHYPIALLLMDLDQFKVINDTLGHHQGDILLKEVALRFKSVLFSTDLVARMGGDEFAVIAPLSESDHTGILVDKIMKALEPPFKIAEIPIRVEISIGIAFFPDHGNDPESLIRNADIAMYLAKRKKKGYVIYDRERDQHDPRKLALMSELRRAIEQDELVLHYQPKIDLKTNQVIGVEALLRWMHPERGLIPPDQFIGLAEHTGLIKPLSEWVFNAAHRQCQVFHEKGKNLSIAINMSSRNVQDTELQTMIEEKIERSGVEPGVVELEITESAIMDDPDGALKVMRQLRALGISFTIDDFGTGYSSLSYLKKLPVSALKIDRTFVMEMTTNEDDAAIVRSTIDLGHSLGLSVIAEGVENRETYERLAAMGCDAAQGYYMCKPIPPEALNLWLNAPYWES